MSGGFCNVGVADSVSNSIHLGQMHTLFIGKSFAELAWVHTLPFLNSDLFDGSTCTPNFKSLLSGYGFASRPRSSTEKQAENRNQKHFILTKTISS